MRCDVDVLVVGGGPAGTAAAIWSAQSGLRTTLVERLKFPRHRPGETLHPGVQAIFRQLGVEDQVDAESAIRHDAVAVDWGGRAGFHEFGADENGLWKGYQIYRERLDAILIQRARKLGVSVLQPTRALAPLLENGCVRGAYTSSAVLRAGFVIDATGHSSWLKRHLRLSVRTASPPLHAIYGYCACGPGSLGRSPRLTANSEGWTWTAEIEPGRIQFTHVSLPRSKRTDVVSDLPMPIRSVGKLRGADVTWRCVSTPAGPGYFIAGDAAIVLDPSSSHGVLRALMSGMMAIHAINCALSDRISKDIAREEYTRWMERWFAQDVRSMSRMYQELDPIWAQDA